MKMYLVATTFKDDVPIYCLYRTLAEAEADFLGRIGEYIYHSLLDHTVSGFEKVNVEEISHLFSKCYVSEGKYIIFDEMEIYIEELEVKD